MWKVYILLSVQYRKTYTGSTNDFQRRLQQHNDGEVESTKHFRPWVPIYIELYPTEQEARGREQYLKSASGRKFLKQAINGIIEKWLNCHLSSAGPPRVDELRESRRVEQLFCHRLCGGVPPEAA